MTTFIGGSFAPPLPDTKLTRYEKLAETAPEKVKEAMLTLIKCVKAWKKEKPSAVKGSPHPSGRGTITPLTKEQVKKLWNDVPWMEEITLYETWFDTIPPTSKELRDAAFHLTWFAKELTMDREPVTNDLL